MSPWLSRYLAQTHDALAAIGPDGRVLGASAAWAAIVPDSLAAQVGQRLIAAPAEVTGGVDPLAADAGGERRVVDGAVAVTAWSIGGGRLLARAHATGPATGAPAFSSRFHSLFDAFPFAIGVHRDLRFLYVNRAAAAYLGYTSPKELVGTPIVGILDPSEVDAVKARVGHMMRTGEALPERETRLRSKGGAVVLAELSAFAIPDDDGQTSYVVVARDITERKALEERLHHGQRMEAIGRLAGGIAHDFNNLLAVILSYAELLGHALPEDSAEAEHAHAILRGAERAAALTQQLLTFSRGQTTEPGPLRVNDVVLGLEGFLRRTLGGQVRLVTLLQGNLPPMRASAAQLEQLLVNLAINARDAMPEAGGEVRVQTSLVHLRAAAGWAGGQAGGDPEALEPGPYVCIEVVDDGAGMPPEVASRAFEPFFTTKTPGKGTGLGLSTVYGIVRQAGGRCEITSRPGAGTTVRILWPAEAAAPLAPVAPGPLAPPSFAVTGPATPVSRPLERPTTAGGRVLVVEDEDAVRILVARLLRGKGYEVVEAAGGPEALRAAERLAAEGLALDLVLSDVVMPEMTGVELAAELRGRFPSLPFIFMSGFADDVVETDDLAQQGFGFVAKPFQSSDLIAQVRQALAARRG